MIVLYLKNVHYRPIFLNINYGKLMLLAYCARKISLNRFSSSDVLYSEFFLLCTHLLVTA